MKTKTQIKRKAKRMLSLLLTAMLLISTMVVGISTVSAATERTVYFVNRDGWTTVKAYCWYSDNTGDHYKTAWPGENMTEAGTYDGKTLYKYTLDTKYTHIIFNNGGGGTGNQTDNLEIPSDKNLYDSTITNNKGWTQYSELDHVATSVSLTPTTQDINAGDSATLTATLTGKKSDTVTLTLVDGNGTNVETKSVTTDSATFTVTPSAETTYKVVARADGYNSVESAAVTVHIVGSKTFYLFYSNYTKNQDNPNEWPRNNKIVMTYEDGKYVGVIKGVATTNNYFAINNNDSLSPANQLWTMDTKDQIELTNESLYINNNAYGVGDYGNIVTFRYHANSSASSIKIIFDGENAITLADAGSTPVDNVTINVPAVDNATVTAVANSTTYNEGDSFEIEVGSSFTVNVAGENGYTLNKITYGTQSRTETGANFKAESGVTTFSVAMDQPVPDTVTINVPTVANATVKVTAGGQEYTSGTFDIQVGSSFTVNVTPATGYKFGNISYNSVNYNNGEAITAVKDVTNIAVTVAVDTVNVDFTKLNNATINVSYINDQATSATAEITADTTLAMQKGTEFTVTVTPTTDYELKSIAYGTATSSENPATFTASADGAVTVTVEQTTPVVETVTVTVPFVENASVAVEYTNNRGAKTTTTITDANADIVMEKDTNFTVTLNVNSGYKCDTITMTYASLSKSDNPATFTASANGTLAITADISQTLTGEATIKFKSARSYMYKVSMSVNGAAATEMTRPDKASTSNDDNFGTSYTGTLTFCWYTQKITVTNGDTTTLSFKTSGTKLNAKVSAKLEAGKTYYFAVDDIAPSSNTEVTAVELPSGNTQSDQMKRNYFHSARHLIYNGTTEDSVLGFTNINNQKYMIGQLLNNSNSADALSVVSATAVQKSVSSVEEYSDLQNTLLDANMNGKLDVKDATLIQKAVVGLV